jgi:hypothetical protein
MDRWMEGGVESPEGVRYISILYDIYIYINSILILYFDSMLVVLLVDSSGCFTHGERMGRRAR